MQINHFLEKSAEKFPDKRAVWYTGKWMTYSELDTAANKLANFLIKIGTKREDRIALLIENSFDYIISYFAGLKVGGIVVALNTDTTSDALEYLLNDSEAKIVISQKKYLRHLLPVLARLKQVDHIITDLKDLDKFQEYPDCTAWNLETIYEKFPPENPGVRCIDVDLAALVYTSGSTGKPKGVMLTHLNIVTNTRSIVQYLKLTEFDRIMVILPFFYIYGMSLLNTHIYTGGSLVIDNHFAFPNVVIDTMHKAKVTGFAGVPSTFLILLNKSTIKKQKFPALRYVTQAGGAMAPRIQKNVADVFSPAKLYIMYGATEASARLSYLHPDWLSKKWGSIGKAIPNVELFIADENGKRLPANAEGEIVARGLNIMQGYWNDPEGTNQVLKGELYFTGDIGKMDDDGFFYVVGRKKDMIKVGGQRVSAKEVEEALLDLPEIHEVSVIGSEDEYLGEAIIAFIVPNSDQELSEKQILMHCKKHLPQYKTPRKIIILPDLPKNESGKILKTKLKELLV
jgi:acyl-CoA synthetase (AMP-forming)/AMP-acid ligase II